VLKARGQLSYELSAEGVDLYQVPAAG